VELKTFIVAGTPGAGKTTVLSKVRFEKIGKITHVNMGNEMLKHASIGDRDMLRYLSTEKQKELRAKAIEELSRNKGVLVIDTHLSVKHGSTYLPGFSTKELKKLNVKGIFYIDADAKEIMKRRKKDKSRKREMESEDEINMQREVNLALLAVAATELNIPIYMLRNIEGKADEVAEEMKNLLKGAVK